MVTSVREFPFDEQDINDAIEAYGGMATAHEVNLYIGLKHPWDKERALAMLSHYTKVPIAEIGREYAAIGGNIKWAYAPKGEKQP